MKPSEKDSETFKLPDGTSVSLWASSDTGLSPWSFFWADFERRKPPQAWYRVFRVGKSPGDWLPMQSGDVVLQQTGYSDDADAEPSDPQLGAAEKLTRGRYVLQIKCCIAHKDVELAGVTFSVK